MSEKSKLNFARIFTLTHNGKSEIAEFYTSSDMIDGIVEYPKSEPSSGERGTNYKLYWDFHENGLLRVAVFRKKNPPPSEYDIDAGGCYLELVRSLSIDPKTGDVLPYYDAQQRMEKRGK